MTPINSGWDESFQCQIVRVISRNATSRHISSLQSVDENHVTRTELGDASKKSWLGRDSNLDLHFAGSGYWPEAVTVVLKRLWTLVAGFVQFSQTTMTQTNVYDVILRTRNGLGLTPLALRSSKNTDGRYNIHPRSYPQSRNTIVRNTPWLWQQLSLLHWLHWQVGPKFIPSLASVRLSKWFLGLHRIKATCGSVYILHNPL